MAMEQRSLGASGLAVSVLSLGSWLTYETMPEEEALAVMQAGLSAGINFLDDARYNDRTGTAPLATGYSEVLFGRLLRKTGINRNDLVIGNKIWFEFFPQESIEAELDGSLGRIGIDHIDIVYCDKRPDSLPLAEMIGQLDGLIAAGKLRAWGVLNWSAAQIQEARDVAAASGLRPPTGAQLAYSVLHRAHVEDDAMRRACGDTVGIVASYSLQGGLLSGKYRSGGAADGRLTEWVARPELQPMLPKVDAFVGVAERLGCTPSQLAMAYCLRNTQVSSVLFGARQVKQVQDNRGALEVLPRLTDDVIAELRAL